MESEKESSQRLTRRARTRGARAGEAAAARPAGDSGDGGAGDRQRAARRARGVRVRGAGRGPRTIQQISIQNIEDLPVGQGLKTPLHPYRPRKWRPYTPPSVPSASQAPSSPPSETEAASSSSPSPSSSAVSSSAMLGQVASPGSSGQTRPLSHPRQSLNERDDLTMECFQYGSEPDSGESDDEDLAPFLFPRAHECDFETPIDLEEESADPAPAPADPAPAPADPAPADDPPAPADPAPTATDQPWNLYDFDWTPFPNAFMPAALRRETFSETNVGPTAPCVDPYEIFTSIWDRQFMEYIASETNRYAQQVADQMIRTGNLHPNSRIGRWKDTTADELYTFLALILAMGVVVKTRIDEYWSGSDDVFCTPGFRVRMSFDRFILLNRCLHFSNNEDMLTLELDASEAKLFKIQPVLTHLNDRFQSLYRLEQNVALDESLLLWKGWLNINQLIRNKAAMMGIKTYEICESQTGYLWRFEVHSHKQRSSSHQSEDPLNTSTPAIVLRLIHGLEGKGHTLWMDNFYNSPILARHLKSIGFDCAGTLRTNRRFVPRVLHSLTKENMLPGEITGLTSGDVDIMVWRDVNRVAMISTYHGNAVSNVRGTIKPILIHDYNIMMGGVDKKDQMLSQYPIERKRTKIWYKKLFRRLLNVSVLNSFIIHRSSVPSFPDSKLLSHRQFRITLVNSLLSTHISSFLPATIRSIGQDISVDVTHRLVEYPFGPRGPSGKWQRIRRQCVKCKKLVRTHCFGCKRTVCMDPCFLAIHS